MEIKVNFLSTLRGLMGEITELETNLNRQEINFNGFSNIYIPKNTSQEVNAVGLRRLCHIFKRRVIYN